MLHHITKYEGFLMNGIIVMEFRSCNILKILHCRHKGLTRALMPDSP